MKMPVPPGMYRRPAHYSSEPDYIYQWWPIKLVWASKMPFKFLAWFKTHGIHAGFVPAPNTFGQPSHAKVLAWVFHIGRLKIVFGHVRLPGSKK